AGDEDDEPGGHHDSLVDCGFVLGPPRSLAGRSGASRRQTARTTEIRTTPGGSRRERAAGTAGPARGPLRRAAGGTAAHGADPDAARRMASPVARRDRAADLVLLLPARSGAGRRVAGRGRPRPPRRARGRR